MRVLLVSDLHYDLRKLDWLMTQAPSYDLLAIAGDLLNIASPVPLDVQIAVVLESLARLQERTSVAVCSGNHDLDSVTVEGEKQCSWILEARDSGVIVDGDTAQVAGWHVTSCAWWEGPATLATLKAGLSDQQGKALWLWHGPPAGPLAFDGRRQHDDPELPALLVQHRPDVVLCGHIHQAPFVDGGAWAQHESGTWLFNAGGQMGPVPCAIDLDLTAGSATWVSQQGRETVSVVG